MIRQARALFIALFLGGNSSITRTISSCTISLRFKAFQDYVNHNCKHKAQPADAPNVMYFLLYFSIDHTSSTFISFHIPSSVNHVDGAIYHQGLCTSAVSNSHSPFSEQVKVYYQYPLVMVINHSNIVEYSISDSSSHNFTHPPLFFDKLHTYSFSPSCTFKR